MTYPEAYREATTWQRRIRLIFVYHTLMVRRNSSWKVTDTAKHFGISSGLASESINLAEKYDKVKHCCSRAEALRTLKGINNG